MAFELRRLWIWLFPKGEETKQQYDESIGDTLSALSDSVQGADAQGRHSCARRHHPLFPGQRDSDCFDCHLLDRLEAEWAQAKPPTPGAELTGALLCLKGAHKGESFPLLLAQDTPIYLGADPDQDIVLRDKTVSRRHLMITRRHARIILRDLGSLHHSAIRSEGEIQWQALDPQREYWFRDGTHLTIGDVEFLFRSTDEQGLRSYRASLGEPPRALSGGAS